MNMKTEPKYCKPQCKNCAHVCWTVNKYNPRGYMHEYICGDGAYAGISVYPFDVCYDHKKKYHRNSQLDINDAKEALENE